MSYTRTGVRAGGRRGVGAQVRGGWEGVGLS
ncbi:hypothetical protein SFR_3313 [Streptomyces sp. FR-008]|nr:hypothetical protein SFR_3313 [Streptomyces sp. FR-008]